MIQPAPVPPSAQPRISPYQQLLPPGITLETMLSNTAMQYEWHQKLCETAGSDVGQK